MEDLEDWTKVTVRRKDSGGQDVAQKESKDVGGGEAAPVGATHRHFSKIRHVHVNEINGAHCGTADYDFKPVLATLERLNYQGWVSLEAFDFKPGAETIAHDSLRFLESQIAILQRNG